MEKITLLANPNQVRPSRFWGVYTKLKIFNMTDYRKGELFNLNVQIVQNLAFLSIIENLGKGCQSVVIFGWITHFTFCVYATFQKQCIAALCLISITPLCSGSV